jgi:hypothetical protein
LTVKMYPMQEVNVARSIEGRAVEKGYAAPNMYQLPKLG